MPELARTVIKKAKFPMLATMDGDQPRVRPLSPVKVDGFTIYIANLKSYEKTAQIRANPKVELCYLDEDHNQVRITGRAEVVADRSVLEEIWRKNRLLEYYLGSIDNPELIVCRIIPLRVTYYAGMGADVLGGSGVKTGITVLWYYGIMVLWYYGIAVSRYYGIAVC